MLQNITRMIFLVVLTELSICYTVRVAVCASFFLLLIETGAMMKTTFGIEI